MVNNTAFVRVRGFILGVYQKGSDGVDRFMVSSHPVVPEDVRKFFRYSFNVRKRYAYIPLVCAISVLGFRLSGFWRLVHPWFVTVGFKSRLDMFVNEDVVMTSKATELINHGSKKVSKLIIKL